MDKNTAPQIELQAVPSEFSPGEFRACIMRNGAVSYLSQQSWPSADEAQLQAGLVFAGVKSGYRY